VKDTLRRLEDTIPILQKEHELDPDWLGRGPEDVPLPPPAEFPLRPRPRASEYLRRFLGMVCERTVQPVSHTIQGPPYSLVIVDKPDASNAFSYGFGPDGGGGIVVYSGFLDDILSKESPDPTPHVVSSPEETSWWSFLLGGFFSLTPPPPRHPLPSPEQTTELAILLAHELAHLILSHHLETLSSGTVIAPGIISMTTDIVRTIIFPITMMFGPFVNDAVAQLGKVGSGELVKVGEYCTSMKQEVEADVVSARSVCAVVVFHKRLTKKPSRLGCSRTLVSMPDVPYCFGKIDSSRRKRLNVQLRKPKRWIRVSSPTRQTQSPGE
jgi:hypothetical protein